MKYILHGPVVSSVTINSTGSDFSQKIVSKLNPKKSKEEIIITETFRKSVTKLMFITHGVGG